MSDGVWSQPHHDGSPSYVPDPRLRLGGTVDVFLRVPRASDVTSRRGPRIGWNAGVQRSS